VKCHARSEDLGFKPFQMLPMRFFTREKQQNVECQRISLAFLANLTNEWAALGLHENLSAVTLKKEKSGQTGIEPATSSLGKWTVTESKRVAAFSSEANQPKMAPRFEFSSRKRP
jgi:hypothetical protein